MQEEARTYSLTLAYDGAPFSGFARQPGQLTVQGEVEQALSTVLHRPVEVTCAGRTDSGVHARAQVVSFTVDAAEMASRKPEVFLRSLNALSHDGISIRALDARPAGFSARFDAKMREYRYFIFNHEFPPVFTAPFTWHVKKPLDVEAMRAAAAHLVGEHDFKSFCLAASAEGRRTFRYVDEVSFHECTEFSEPLLYVKVRGNAFLHSMVRAMVGTLVNVGKHTKPPEWVKAALEARTRSAAGENAPACGLVLWDVEY